VVSIRTDPTGTRVHARTVVSDGALAPLGGQRVVVEIHTPLGPERTPLDALWSREGLDRAAPTTAS
jgi:hypothetical protein